MKNILLLGLAFIAMNLTFAQQVNIPMHNTDYATDFNGWNGTLPTGFSHSGSTSYQGTSSPGTAGGTYAVAGNGYGFQASGSSTSLSLTGTFKNTTGSEITELEISYEAFRIEHRSSRIPQWTVTSSLGDVGALTWDYNEAATGAAPDELTVTLSGISIPDNGTFTLTFSADRGSGSGSTPKIGLNDITVKSIFAPCDILTSGFDNLTCSDNLTPGDALDDFLTFDLNPTGDEIGGTYNVSVSSGTITPSTATYGVATSFQLNDGSAGGGDVVVTITDGVSATCTLPFTVVDPGACSVPCVVTGTDVQIACESYEWIDGLTYTVSTDEPTFNLVGAAEGGCDSLVTLNLTINYTATGTDVQTACESFVWIDGLTYTESNDVATFNLVGAAENGCDSIVTLNLTINNSTTGTDIQTACESFVWIDGLTYTESTDLPTFNLVGAAENGCDSLVTLNLTINNSTTGTDVQTACGSFVWIDGLTYTESTDEPTFNLVGAAENGCDSLVTLNLTINEIATGTDVQTACGSFVWIDGLTYTESTDVATFNLVGAAENGCDSLVTLNLTINEIATGTDVQTACESFVWIDGLTYTESTDEPTFTIVGGAENGCDSIVTLNLTINYNTTGTDIQTACESFVWIDGLTYTESTDEPTFNLVGGSETGCDSLVTLNLTINYSTTGTDVQTACESFVWIDGLTYTESTDEATFNIVGGSENGCDSLVTLNLTINEIATGTDVQTACESFVWIDGLTYTESTDEPTFAIVGGAENGCDSLVTLNLTINEIATGTDVQTACESFVWIDGVTYTESTDEATFNIVGGAESGCDSLVTLNLTIQTVDVSVTNDDPTLIANATDADFQWIDCSTNTPIAGETSATYTALENGSYAVKVTQGECIDTSDCMAIVSLGFDELLLNSVKIYPNPSNGSFTLDLGLLDQPNISIYSVDNKLVYNQNSVNSSLISIELLDQAGIYFLVITKDEMNYTYKLIIQ